MFILAFLVAFLSTVVAYRAGTGVQVCRTKMNQTRWVTVYVCTTNLSIDCYSDMDNMCNLILALLSCT